MAHAFKLGSKKHENCKRSESDAPLKESGTGKKSFLSFVQEIDDARASNRLFAQTTLKTKQTVSLINLYLFMHFRRSRDMLAPPCERKIRPPVVRGSDRTKEYSMAIKRGPRFGCRGNRSSKTRPKAKIFCKNHFSK